MATAKAIVTYAEDDWRMEDVTVQEPGDEQLQVRVIASGVCHTGMKIKFLLSNHTIADQYADVMALGGIFPRVLGHEGL